MTDGLETPQLNDEEIVTGFRVGEVAGRAVMERLFEKVGKPVSMLDRPLISYKGEQMVYKGKPLKVGEYLTIADKHPGAVDAILNFVGLPRDHEDFVDFAVSVAAFIDETVEARDNQGAEE